jgi:pimeloyl-ACP methyl ester carboxylesterase
MKPLSSGYADVNGIKLYHEIYGQGEPVVLIHGGLTTIGEMQRWVRPLAKTWQVIAVEMQATAAPRTRTGRWASPRRATT